MFCPNCGNKLNDNEIFCSFCRSKIKKDEKPIQINNVVENNISKNLTEQLKVQNKHFMDSISDKLEQLFKIGKNFILNNKKIIGIVIGIISIIVVWLVLFYNLYDFTKIEWNKEYNDTNIIYTEPTTLTLSVLAFDKEKKQINEINFESNDGELIVEGNNVKWKLPNKAGIYTITAIAPSGKKIKKEVKVIELKDENQPLNGILDENNNEISDNDNDGLLNEREIELGTNPNLADTDRDGLSDYYEIYESKTDPLKADTDNDGLTDGNELDLGFDPLKSDSKNDGIQDDKRELSYTIKNDKQGLTLKINGKGNIASTTVDIFKNQTFSNIDGLIDKIYNFHTNGTIDSAHVTIKYNINDIKEKGITENNLTIYYFNEETKELEALPTTVDITNKTVSTTLNHFSKYLIGDSNVVITKTSSEILFVIDDSVSMYSTKQLELAGYSSTGAVGNDTTFKRLSLTNKLIDMFTGNYKFGVSEFSGKYTKLKDFDSNHDVIKEVVNGIKNSFENNVDGTNIITALNNGIKEFSNNKDNHYLILLTDGKNTNGSLLNNKNTIIKNAKNKNIKICVIGLGSQIDGTELNEIAESTGCDYYNASDSSALDEIYSLMGATINYNYVDTDGDSKVDGMIMEDSGFIVNRDGFSFGNYNDTQVKQGHCYGMATFAMLYYTKKLPMKLNYADKYNIFKRLEPAVGYNLNNTYFSSNNNLYDFKTKNTALTYYLYGDNIPNDLRDRIENDTWMLKQEYYDLFDNIGSEFIIKDYKGNDSEFSKYQAVLLNIHNDKFKNNMSNDEIQLLLAIYRLFILQVDHNTTSFGNRPDQAFEELNTQLKNGIPVVINIGSHAVNAIRLIQDNNDANKFKLEIYDNNYPGKTRYIEITRSKYSKWQLNYTAWTNEYDYTFKYDRDNDGILDEIDLILCYPNVE